MAYQMMPSAIEQYAKEHDGKLPMADKWNDTVRPYYSKITKNRKELGPMKIMDANSEWGCQEASGKTGMVFNSEVAGKKLDDIADKSTVLLFESTKTGKNLAEKYVPLPFDKSPLAFDTKDHRGWIIVTVARQMYFLDKDGKRIASSSGATFSSN
jgi:hypothetical protein